MNEIKKRVLDKSSDKGQELREKLFEMGRNFRDKTMKEFGYEYPQSWLLYNEDYFAEVIDEIEEHEDKKIDLTIEQCEKTHIFKTPNGFWHSFFNGRIICHNHCCDYYDFAFESILNKERQRILDLIDNKIKDYVIFSDKAIDRSIAKILDEKIDDLQQLEKEIQGDSR